MGVGHTIIRISAGAAGALLAQWILGKWILRASDDAPTGFVTVAPGFGLDDVVIGLGVTAGVLAGLAIVKKV